MTTAELKILSRKYYLPEIMGIVSALLMALVSLIPALQAFDMRQMTVALFFLMLFGLKLLLFVWNRKAEGTYYEKREQAKMMLVSAIVLLLMHSVAIVAVLYQLLSSKKTPLMASLKVLAIVYGVYAIVKIATSIRGIVIKQKINRYSETLSYLGWVGAVYTICLFTNYLLITEKADYLIWARYIMISIMGLTTIVLAFLMFKKAIGDLRQ